MSWKLSIKEEDESPSQLNGRSSESLIIPTDEKTIRKKIKLVHTVTVILHLAQMRV